MYIQYELVNDSVNVTIVTVFCHLSASSYRDDGEVQDNGKQVGSQMYATLLLVSLDIN